MTRKQLKSFKPPSNITTRAKYLKTKFSDNSIESKLIDLGVGESIDFLDISAKNPSSNDDAIFQSSQRQKGFHLYLRTIVLKLVEIHKGVPHLQLLNERSLFYYLKGFKRGNF